MSETAEAAPATGSAEDMVARQAAVLPRGWFGAAAWFDPVVGALLAMAAEPAAWMHALAVYARKQSRLATMDGGWLDLFAYDFFGYRIRRRTGQSDDAFRRRIKIELFRQRNTRAAMIEVLTDLTGRAPRVFEPSRPADTGAIGIHGAMGMGVAGAIGTLNRPGEVFLDVFRTPSAGIAFAAGIGVPSGGMGVPSRLVMSDLNRVRGSLTDDDIIAAVEATRTQGVTVWLRIRS